MRRFVLSRHMRLPPGHGSGDEIQPDWLPDGRLIFTERVGNEYHLRWLDPADPGEVYDIPLPGDDPRYPAPAAVR